MAQMPEIPAGCHEVYVDVRSAHHQALRHALYHYGYYGLADFFR